jgi:hypothetical protein
MLAGTPGEPRKADALRDITGIGRPVSESISDGRERSVWSRVPSNPARRKNPRRGLLRFESAACDTANRPEGQADIPRAATVTKEATDDTDFTDIRKKTTRIATGPIASTDRAARTVRRTAIGLGFGISTPEGFHSKAQGSATGRQTCRRTLGGARKNTSTLKGLHRRNVRQVIRRFHR